MVISSCLFSLSKELFRTSGKILWDRTASVKYSSGIVQYATHRWVPAINYQHNDSVKDQGLDDTGAASHNIEHVDEKKKRQGTLNQVGRRVCQVIF